ncbi:putative small nuclear ribonucleoprotein associated protein, partial [Gregarina niphandrodes]
VKKMGRSSRLQQWIGFRVRVTLHDGRMLVGVLMAFDRHMNLVLSDTEEFRLVKKKHTAAATASNPKGNPQELKRVLGLIMLRGEGVVSFVPEAPVDSGTAAAS